MSVSMSQVSLVSSICLDQKTLFAMSEVLSRRNKKSMMVQLMVHYCSLPHCTKLCCIDRKDVMHTQESILHRLWTAFLKRSHAVFTAVLPRVCTELFCSRGRKTTLHTESKTVLLIEFSSLLLIPYSLTSFLRRILD
jgi:hypothetical protein